MATNASLYERLGGREGISTVVDDFYDRVLADEQLRPFFEDVDTERLRTHQTQFISSVTGGPVEYTGGDMEESHAGLDIREDDFAVVAHHLQASLDAAGVPEDDVEDVMGAVASFEDDVVTPAD